MKCKCGMDNEDDRPLWQCLSGAEEESTDASHLNKAEATTAETSNQQGKIERDYEPEQAYGTAHDFKEHVRFGGDRNDY